MKKKIIRSIIAICLLEFAAICVFEASPMLAGILHVSHRWFDALSVMLFLAGFCASAPFAELEERLRHAKDIQ